MKFVSGSCQSEPSDHRWQLLYKRADLRNLPWGPVTTTSPISTSYAVLHGTARSKLSCWTCERPGGSLRYTLPGRGRLGSFPGSTTGSGGRSRPGPITEPFQLIVVHSNALRNKQTAFDGIIRHRYLSSLQLRQARHLRFQKVLEVPPRALQHAR